MAWTLEFETRARRQLAKLPHPIAERVARGIRELSHLDNPRSKGRARAGVYAGYWRYRIGDYRVVARIEDGRMVIVVIAIGHRREVYR